MPIEDYPFYVTKSQLKKILFSEDKMNEKILINIEIEIKQD